MKIRVIQPICLPEMNLLANSSHDLPDDLAQSLIDGGLVIADIGQPIKPMTTLIIETPKDGQASPASKPRVKKPKSPAA